MSESIAIVLPTCNRKEITLRFIREIGAQDSGMRVYVCDSDSKDGTVEALSALQWVEIIHVGAAAWWSAAVNQGIERAISQGCSGLLIMNDDIEFDSQLLTKLLEKHRQYPDSIISPLQESPSGPFLGMRYFGWMKRMELLGDADSDITVDTTNGCCLFVPGAVFSRVGKFDEIHCPHQYGDTEFQLRAGKQGFPTIACPSIRITQLGATDYYSRLRLGSMLTFPGSPLHFRAYFQFGVSLFGGGMSFLMFGAKYHYGYVKTLAKAVAHIVTRRIAVR